MAIFSRKYSRWYLREATAGFLFLLAVGIGLLVYWSDQPSYRKALTITAGSVRGLRSQIARRLAIEAAKQGVTIRVVGSEGSKEALEMLDRGSIELALVQGGIDPRPIRMFDSLPLCTSSRSICWSRPTYMPSFRAIWPACEASPSTSAHRAAGLMIWLSMCSSSPA